MKDVVERYIEGLEQAYRDNNGDEYWDEFVEVKEGISDENIAKLKSIYGDVPQELIELLSYADGTYFRVYKDSEICLYFLGSDLEEYPYYLLSSDEIIEHQNYANETYYDYVDRKYKELEIDDRIIDDSSKIKWLHFADCMNNGGTSQLFIDFSPSESGKVGQVLMYVHDPDSITVIADSFAEYLQYMIDSEYDFINEDCL